MIKKVLSIFILFLIAGSLFAQTPFIRNYTPEESNSGTQNWSIVQDQQGIMYFANKGGVLEYDGINWRTIETRSSVLSLCIDSSNCIYVGLDNEFGYLHPDSTGLLQYKSLKPKFPKEYQDFNSVRYIESVEGKIILWTVNKIFVYQNDSVSLLMSGDEFSYSHVVRGKYYFAEKKKGLMYLEGDSLLQIPGSEQFSKINPRVMLPYGDDEILIFTNNSGIEIFNPKKSPCLWKPDGFDTVSKLLIKNNANNGVKLPNEHFAISTKAGGIFVFDKHGKIHNHYNKQNGLQSNTSYCLFTDLNGQLWAALQNGISLIMNNIPFVNYTDKNGLDGAVYSVQKFKNKLYVGTSNNLYVQNKKNKFESIEGTAGQNFFLLQANGKLLLGNNPNGLSEINSNQVVQQSEALKISAPYLARRLRKFPNYIITLVWNKGLALIEYKNEQWVFKHFIKGFDKNARYIEEDVQGNFWINSNMELYKFRINETLDSIISWQEFIAEQYQLPETAAEPFRLNDGEIIFGSEKGIYRYLADENYFEPHPDFHMLSGQITYFKQDASGNIWFGEYKEGISEIGVLRSINGKYEMDKTPFLKFTDITIPNDYALYPYSDSLVYIGTNKGLLEFHPKQIVNYDIPFNTLIRKIYVKDSLFYGGAANDSISNTENIVKLKYEENDLFFHYSATFYEDSEKNLFSYRLIGSSDTIWSAWTNDYKKEYTNLNEGKYIFEVRSQNRYQKLGNKAAFTFEILPPWQRTLWAYALYGALAVILILIIVRLNSARLKRQNELLKQTVKERTADILEQKEELQTQADELQVQSKELQATNIKLIELDHFKEGMTGMIVHDLKNPLSTIIGLSKSQEIVQSGKQMLNMVLNILDVQKFEDAEVKLQLEDFSATGVINDSLKQVQLLLDRKSINTDLNINPKANFRIDAEIVNRVMVNILTNAIKYTPNNGSVTITAEPEVESDFVKVSIIDTGEGIPKDKLAFVFDKFSQVEAKKSGGVASTGLGLTFCKLAIEAHNGEIGVESVIEKGTTFWFLLPKAKSSDIEIEDTTTEEDETAKELLDSDIIYLNPFIVSLKTFTVYEFSDIITILNKIESNENSAIQYWKTDLENAVRACNEEKYNEVLKLKNDV